MQIDHSAPAIYGKQSRRKLGQPLGRCFRAGQQGERDQRIRGKEIERDGPISRMFFHPGQQLLRGESQVLRIRRSSGRSRERVFQHSRAQRKRRIAGFRLQPGPQTHEPSNQA